MEGENTTTPEETTLEPSTVIDAIVKDDFQAEISQEIKDGVAFVQKSAFSGDMKFDTQTESPATEFEIKVKQKKQPKKAVEIATKPVEKVVKANNRFSAMVNFSGEKGEILKAIIQNGIEQDYWQSTQHFFTKVVDFAINSELVHAHLKVTDAYIFGVPDNVETKLFANGYYENDSKLKLPTC